MLNELEIMKSIEIKKKEREEDSAMQEKRLCGFKGNSILKQRCSTHKTLKMRDCTVNSNEMNINNNNKYV